MHNYTREPQPYEDCQAKSIQEFGWTSQGMDWGWGQGIKSTTHRRVKKFGYSCRQRRLTWAKEKKNWTSGPKSSFQMRASFVFHLRTNVLESGGRVEKLIAQVAWRPVLSFHSLWWFGCNVTCWCWSTEFFENQRHCTLYQEILEHFMLPSADQLFKDADFIFQQDLTPAHTDKSTKSWLNDHVLDLLYWPANSPDLNIENLWSIVKRKMRNKRPKNADELKVTVKETWASYRLSSATNWSPPCHAELRQ